MNRDSLVSAVAESTGFSKKRVSLVLDGIVREIIGAVADGDTVRIKRFGTFRARFRASRSIRSFGRELVTTTEKHIPEFLPSEDFREAVKEGYSGGENHSSGG